MTLKMFLSSFLFHILSSCTSLESSNNKQICTKREKKKVDSKEQKIT